jgi:hypothetical protein
MRKSTWLAVVVCLVTVVVPGLFIGALLRIIYIAGLKVGGLPDPLSLHMVFGIDSLRNVVMWILVHGVGEAFQGAIAGFVGAALTGLICRGANILKAVCITGAIYTGLMCIVFLISIVGGWAGTDVTDEVGSVFQIAGLWCGLMIGAAAMRERDRAAAAFDENKNRAT